jgi:hypothetical protein
MGSHGLSPKTMAATAQQLLSEVRGLDRWKRAVILDKLQFDVFRWYYQKIKPRFSTFFLNSTAHYQHFYWRNMEPEIFTVQMSPEDAAKYESAILFGYKEMDGLVGRLMDLVDRETTMVFCTALSQQPYLKFEESGGRHFYRPTSFEALVQFAGIASGFQVAPVMAHQFHLYLETEAAAKEAEVKMRALAVNGRQAMAVERSGTQVFCGCHISENLPEETSLEATNGTSAKFFGLFYKVEGMKSGMHHPDGMLWIREPGRRPSHHAEKMPLAAVAPTLLDLLGIPKPARMREDSIRNRPRRQEVPALTGA